MPFLGAMVVLTLFTFWRTNHITSSLVEAEYWNRMDRVADLLVKHPYLLNPTIQSRLEELVGAKIGYYDLQGKPRHQALFSADMDSSSAGWPVLPKDTMNSIIKDQGSLVFIPPETTHDSMILLTQLGGASHEGVVLGLMVPAEPRRELRQNLFFAQAANAGLSLLLLLVLVFSFSRLFSRQLHHLLTTMEKVAEGKLQQQVPETGSPEWQRLATAFNRMVTRLQQYQQRLRASERLAAVGELSAVLAHEVRNPLTSLKMMAQVLRRRHADEPATVQLIDPMLGEVDRIELLVQSILDWSRPSPPQLELVDINSLMSDVLTLITPVFSKSGVEVAWQPGSVATVSVDQAQIKQVLWNLLNNAEHVSGPGDKVEVTTSMLHDSVLQLIIEDQGPGINEELSEKVFEPFYTTRAQGLGLGLTISSRIIEKHGGRLMLKNVPQGGVRAIVSLPVNNKEISGCEEKIILSNQV